MVGQGLLAVSEDLHSKHKVEARLVQQGLEARFGKGKGRYKGRDSKGKKGKSGESKKLTTMVTGAFTHLKEFENTVMKDYPQDMKAVYLAAQGAMMEEHNTPMMVKKIVTQSNLPSSVKDRLGKALGKVAFDTEHINDVVNEPTKADQKKMSKMSKSERKSEVIKAANKVGSDLISAVTAVGIAERAMNK